MPRRSRRDPSPVQRRRGRGREPVIAEVDEIAARIAGPGAPELAVAGFEVRSSTAAKRYRCPYCEGWIEPGSTHIVAFAAGRAEERRHYHTGCWAKVLPELRRRPAPPE